ncbi:chaperone modulator CbpM [Dankookia sp. P2]|uniref:chaperone modulator CbpM n=1 Tax=Dankookia sp. P2 TaxID=3423955 RepID=UPI003D6669EB
MTDIQALSRSLGLAEAEIHRWVALRWLRPEGTPGGWVFQEVDVARIRLIVELRALDLDEEAMPVVLSLLDQLHATRRQPRLLRQAVEETAPDAVRDRLRALLATEG